LGDNRNPNSTRVEGVYHAERYIGSVAGGAMLGAAIAGIWGTLIGALIGIIVATLIISKE
jgi:predicted lipid-binding transport protein (Tim44 family)